MTLRRFQMPREHGAYAQLAFPLLSGLILGRPTLPALGFALSAVVFFLAYEPLVVLLGIRGVRLQQGEGEVARRQLVVLTPLGFLLGLAALIGCPPDARLFAALPAGLLAMLLPLVPARRVKTLAGETVVAAALASMHLPIAAAGGVEGVKLWGPVLVWFAGFFLATLAVHAIKARHKQRAGWIGAAADASAVAAVLVTLALVLAVPQLRTLGAVLAVPTLAVLVVTAARVHPRSLKRIGWTLVAADTATLALLTQL
jgi:hypothetical protein